MKYFFQCLIFIFAGHIAFSQHNQPVIHHLNMENGLSSDIIKEVVEDDFGYIYISTSAGLDRFDGQRIHHFKYDPEDPNSILPYTAQQLLKDSDGKIWMATEVGLSYYNPATGRFKHNLMSGSIGGIKSDHNGRFWVFQNRKGQYTLFDPITEEKILALDYEDLQKNNAEDINAVINVTNNSLWFRSESAFYCFEYNDSRIFLKYKFTNEDFSLERSYPNAVIEYDDDIYFVNTGLYKLTDNNSLEKIYFEPFNNDYIVQSVLHNDQIFFTTKNKEVFVYNITKNSFNELLVETNEVIENIRIEIDEDNKIWAFVQYDKIYQYDRESNSFQLHIDLSISHKEIYFNGSKSANHLTISTDKTYWFNTTTSGIIYFKARKSRFNLYQHSPDDDNGLSSNILLGLYEDKDQNLWVSSDKVNFLPRNSSDFQIIKKPEKIGNYYSMLHLKDDQYLLGGSWLFLIEKHGDSIKILDEVLPIAFQKDGVASWVIFDLFKASNGDIWIGTSRGVSLWKKSDIDNNILKFRNYLNKSFSNNIGSRSLVRNFYEDSDGRIWICYIYGLAYFDAKNDKIVTVDLSSPNAQSLKVTKTLGIVEYKKGEMFMCTDGQGIIKFNKYTGEISIIDEKHGLPSRNLFSIYKDNDDMLWLSSEKGIIRYDPSDHKFNLFTEEDGLQNDLFTIFASHRSKYSGRIYVGGNSGFNSFHPDSIQLKSYQPDVHFSEIIIDENWYDPIALTNSKSSEFSPELTIKPEEKNITIKYTTLDYDAPGKVQFAYFLEGFDKQWTIQRRDENAEVRYQSLPHGSYNLKVKATNADGVWSPHVSNLTINVLPFWWQSTSFKIILSLLLIGVIISFIRYRTGELRRKQKQLTALVNERTKELKYQNNNLNILIGTGHRITASSNIEEVVSQVLFNARELMEIHCFSINIIDKKEIVETWLWKNGHGLKNMKRNVDWNVFNQIKQNIYLPDLQQQKPEQIKQLITEYLITSGSLVSIPLISFQGKMIGNILIHNYKTEAYTQLHIDLLNNIAVYVAISLDNLQAYEAIKEQQKSKDIFFSNVSHELKTPLILINGVLDKISDTARIDKQASEEISMIRRNSDRLSRMINQLLTLSRIEERVEKLVLGKADMLSLTKNILQPFEYYARIKKINFQFHHHQEIDGNMAYLMDTDKIEIILYNLLSNAFKFTAHGGEVVLDLHLKENGISFFVKDNGIGIREEDKPFVFERYYKYEKGDANSKGTGIGLSLVKELVDLHQGQIYFESAWGHGATFFVELQLKKYRRQSKELINIEPLNKQLNLSSISNNPIHLINKDEKETILIVDDEPDMRQFIKMELGETYHYIEAGNGEEGLKLVYQKVPDLVISDIMMPIMDGINFVKKLKENEHFGHIPVIMLTAKVEEETQLEGLYLGVNDYLAKPFNRQILKQKIDNIIHSYRKQKDMLASSLLPQTYAEANQKEKKFLEEMINFLEREISNPKIKVEFMAKELGMSQSVLFRKVKALTGETVNNFIITYRMKKAVNLLMFSKMTISQISFEVGYENPKYFSKSFKKYYGLSPKDYKNNQTRIE